jgi:hypothetical protein
MTNSHEPNRIARPPALSELLRGHLDRQFKAVSNGLAPTGDHGDVVPHEPAAAVAIDPRTAWNEATGVAGFFTTGANAIEISAPLDWPVIISAQEPMAAVPMSFGNFPQLVRDVHSLIEAENPSSLRCPPSGPLPMPSLDQWVAQVHKRSEYPALLVAIGVLRLVRQFDRAAELIARCRANVPTEWEATLANEQAALEWHRGNDARALSLWQSQPPNTPVLFNRGMAALFLGRRKEAGGCLSDAAGRLPEKSGWHHLAKLYFALAG